MSHPDDYKILASSLDPEYIYHSRTGNSRLIVRISFFVGPGEYLPMSFIVDTGNPIGFVFSPTAAGLLGKYNRLKDDERGMKHVNVFLSSDSMQKVDSNRIPLRTPGFAGGCKRFKSTYSATQQVLGEKARNANLIGTDVICKLGLNVKKDHQGFNFINQVLWI